MLRICFEMENESNWLWNEDLNGCFRIIDGKDQWPKDILAASTIDEVISALKGLNTSYAGAWVRNGNLYIAADHARTIPLYYSVGGSDVYITDNAIYLAKKEGFPLDKWNMEEFKNCGFVGNGRTVFDGIAGTKAGELVVISLEEKTVSSIQHFSNFNTFQSKGNIEEFDNIMIDVFKDFIKGLNGRTVLLSLSGGHDSRIIATMLKRLQYENVICYSFGYPGSNEIKIAKKLAEKLDYPCYVVYFDVEEERAYRESEEWKRISLATCCGDSYGLMRDAFVFSRLKKISEIPADSVFVAGHTLEDAFYMVWDHLDEDYEVLNDYLRTFYYMKEIKPVSKVQSKISFASWDDRRDIMQQAGSFSATLRKEVYPRFFCRNAKIAEEFHYGWFFPLIDRRLSKYLLILNRDATYDRRFWYQYAEKYIENFSKDIPYANTIAETHHGGDKRKKWKKIVPGFIFSLARRFFYARATKRIYRFLSFPEVIKLVILNGGIDPNSFLVNDLARLISGERI